MKTSPIRVVLLLVFLAATAAAQSTSTIQGTVMDQSGAAVVGATVTVRNPAISLVRTTTTDSTGLYLFPSLPLGKYWVEVDAKGLQKQVVDGLAVEVARNTLQNFTLKIASTTETVEINAAAPVIESTTMAVGQVIDQKTVQEIPLNGRHFVDLGLLIPGSVTPPQNGFLTAPLRGQGSFQFNTAGQREDTVNFMINGVNLNDMVQNQITFQPSINTVQEFKVDNSTYSAESGRNSGAIVNIATRSGSNAWHGEAFEFVRNDWFDARNYFNREPILQSPFKRNQFGAALGGPIWKDHTFFFFSYEGLRQRQGLTLATSVLSDTQRNHALAVNNPTVVALLDLIPHANDPTGTIFQGSATAPVDIDQWTGDVSHTFSEKDRLHGYYAIQRDKRQEPTLQYPLGATIPGFGDTRQSRRQIMTLNETHVFNSNVVNEARLGFNRIHITFTPNAQLDPADFGINGGVNTAIGIPQIGIRDINLNFGGPTGFPQGRGDTTGVFSDTLSYLRGKHSLKFGGEYRKFFNNNFTGDTGQFIFQNVDLTPVGGDPNANPNAIDFIHGRAISFSVTPGFRPSRISVNALGFFAQDNYRLTPYLTLEMGLRWDWNGTPSEALDRFTVFDPLSGSLLRAGAGVENVYQQNATNFQPRLGFAWDITHTGKTVLRGGYGFMTDQPVSNSVTPLASNPPFASPVTLTTGTITFANAFTAAQAVGLAPQSIEHGFNNSYVQSWNLNMQHQLTTSTALMIGYFGSKGTHLRVLRNINQPLTVGGTVRPFVRLSSSSDFTCPVAPATLCPTLGNISEVGGAANSSYNALWMTATKRLSHGLQFNASYTYSKSLDYNSLSSVANPTFQNSFDIRGDRGLSDYDARHRFVISGFYELPFKGNRAIEGWQLSSIVQMQTGNPVNLVLPAANLNGVGNTVRPDVLLPIESISTGYTRLPNGNLQYFPQAACSATVIVPNCIFFAQTNHFGNLGRNVIIGPGFQNVDFSVLKNTKVTERLTAQFRADMFDLLNHPNFGQPNRVVTPGTAGNNTFGQITNTRFAIGDSGSARQLQFAVKLLF